MSSTFQLSQGPTEKAAAGSAAGTERDTLSRDLSAKGALFQPGVSNAILGLQQDNKTVQLSETNKSQAGGPPSKHLDR